ncbi:Hsp70 family protein [Candidatus Latescibacterota bacterium]
MAHSIGIDFGDTYTRVAYLDDEENPQLVALTESSEIPSIPTCIAYEKSNPDTYSIGWSALRASSRSDMIFYNNLKSALENQYNEKNINEIITDFFNRLFQIVKDKIGDIEKVGLNVPDSWLESSENSKSDILRNIIEEKVGVSVACVTSDPIAAAAYYTFKQQNEENTLDETLLICDAGGNNCVLSLCRLEDKNIDIIKSELLHKSGNAFDKKIIEMNYEKKNKRNDENNYNTINEKLQHYKIMNREAIEKRMVLALEDEHFLKNDIFDFEEVHAKKADCKKAFMPIEKQLVNKLQQIKNHLGKNQLPDIFFVGGFSEYLPLRQTVREYFLSNNEPCFFGKRNKELAVNGVVLGMTLITAEKTQVEAVVERTIGLISHSMKVENNNFTKEKEYIPIIIRGTQPLFYEHTINCSRPLKSNNKQESIHLYIEDSSGEITPVVVEGIDLSDKHIQHNMWRIGMKLDRQSNLKLIIKGYRNGRANEHNLGSLYEFINQGRYNVKKK